MKSQRTDQRAKTALEVAFANVDRVCREEGLGVDSVTDDMGAHRLASERVAESRNALLDFKTALDEHAIVAITDSRGKITYVNDTFCAVSQYPREALLGRDHRIVNSGQEHIDVAFETDGRVTTLAADPKRFKQILVNLLTNAVKFTPEGGRIGLTVAVPEGEAVVRFTGWDTGIGIAPEDQAKLFRAFTQIDSGLARAQEGTGLGLALVAKLGALHGGSVVIESAPGQGSRVIVTLPRVAAPSLKAARAPQAADRRSYRRALVIEDDPTSAAILVNYLTELGVSSVVHSRGEASIDAVIRERSDVILLDILMPHESGWVALATLKDHPGTRDIPVVVVSVVDEPEKSRALGAAAHFTKPVTREQLAGFLQRPWQAPAARAPRPALKALASGPLILLAEDNEANIQTIGGYLEDKGYALSYALNGLVAVKLARELRPALILMDIQMPVMDGLAAIRDIRADAALKDIPIVALTALTMPGDRERCLAAGATEYLSKPVSMTALVALVPRLLPDVQAVQPGAEVSDMGGEKSRVCA